MAFVFSIQNTNTGNATTVTIAPADLRRILTAAQATRYSLLTLTNRQTERQLLLDWVGDLKAMVVNYEQQNVIAQPAPIGTTTVG